MGLFERLPAELISLIIQNTADFATVDNLLSVSRQARAVFRANSRAIIQDLILSNSITSQPEIKKLVTGIAIIHHPSICCTSHYEYMQLANGEGTLEYALLLCQRNADLARCILRIAAQIQRLACICLSTLRQTFVTAVGTSPSRAQRASEPFSYIEEYRAYWALWHLRCYSDLRKAADPTASASINSTESASICQKWMWSREDIKKLDAYNDLSEIDKLRVENIWTVAVILVELGARSWSPKDGESAVLEFASRTVWGRDRSILIPFFSSFGLAQSVEKDHRSRFWCPSHPPIGDPVTKAWKLTLPYCEEPPGQTTLFRSLQSRTFVGKPGPRFYSPMHDMLPYRRSGALLWDSWRMYSTGLMRNMSRGRRPIPGGGSVESDCGVGKGKHITPAWLEIANMKQ